MPTPLTPRSPAPTPAPNPLKRPLDDDISSPYNSHLPSAVPSHAPSPVPSTHTTTTTTTASRPAKPKGAPRERKDKKKDTSHAQNVDPVTAAKQAAAKMGLQRWRQPAPTKEDLAPARRPDFVYHKTVAGVDFYSTTEHPKNRRNFRYLPCRPSHLLPSLAYVTTDVDPFKARLNWEDTAFHVHVDSSGSSLYSEKGFRMSRANVGAREGRWYFECKILSGVGKDGSTKHGNIRVGWARREAPLDAPVGFDAYSYAIRDIEGQKVHMSRPKPFMNTSITKGDVLGLEICLPSLEAQSGEKEYKPNVIRDRIPIRYKNQLYFEMVELAPTKEMEDLANPTTVTANAPQPKTIPGSYIKVYKNGEEMGTPFTDLFAFLPPHSKPAQVSTAREVDDGQAGYYPAVSGFGGGAATLNFGPDFEFPPPGLKRGNEIVGKGIDDLRPIGERYEEMIAEDLAYDIIDEVDLWATSGEMQSVPLRKEAATVEGGIKEMGEDDDED